MDLFPSSDKVNSVLNIFRDKVTFLEKYAVHIFILVVVLGIIIYNRNKSSTLENLNQNPQTINYQNNPYGNPL